MAKYQPAHKKAQPKLNLAKPAVTMAVTASLALSPVLQTAAFAESGTDANDDVKAEQKQASKEEIAAAKADVEKAQKAYDEAKANVEKTQKAYDEAKAAADEAQAGDQEVQVALEAAKKLPSVEDAQAALEAATKTDDEAAAKFHELNNKALKAEDAATAKKNEWDAKLAEANEAQVAVANRKANEAARDEVYQKWSDKNNDVRRDRDAYNESIDELQAANKALAAAKDACTAAKAHFDNDRNNMISATESGNYEREQFWYNQAFGPGGSSERYGQAQADVESAQAAFTTAQNKIPRHVQRFRRVPRSSKSSLLRRMPRSIRSRLPISMTISRPTPTSLARSTTRTSTRRRPRTPAPLPMRLRLLGPRRPTRRPRPRLT